MHLALSEVLETMVSRKHEEGQTSKPVSTQLWERGGATKGWGKVVDQVLNLEARYPHMLLKSPDLRTFGKAAHLPPREGQPRPQAARVQEPN